VNILKSLPQRTCIGCNEKKNKNELIRVVRDKEGNISIDGYLTNGLESSDAKDVLTSVLGE